MSAKIGYEWDLTLCPRQPEIHSGLRSWKSLNARQHESLSHCSSVVIQAHKQLAYNNANLFVTAVRIIFD